MEITQEDIKYFKKIQKRLKELNEKWTGKPTEVVLEAKLGCLDSMAVISLHSERFPKSCETSFSPKEAWEEIKKWK